ncbi:MAG: CBS domain-containing protein [Ignavibacteriales bacterium]|nr:CBS domain-containing protein [Ignavibacteriales bacterium]
MNTVREILEIKGKTTFSISPNVKIIDALKLMAEKEIGALLVCEGVELVGIISERDYARKVALLGKSSRETSVNEIMSADVLYINIDQTIEECMALMTNKRVRHLPVLQDEKLCGIISIGDVVKALIDKKEFMIDQLVHYIKGAPSITNNG